MSECERWTPDKGQKVWLNYPGARRPLGRVVGFVPDGEHRAGQPIIEALEDEPRVGTFGLERKAGDRFVTHPMFLLPFRYGGKKWRRANAEGRVG